MARAAAPVLFSPTTRSSVRESLACLPSNGTPMAKTPDGALSGAGAAELLQGMLMGASSTALVEETACVSRKDKSLGLLCDNFLQLFACGFSATVELEPVANRLGVGRRRIYDIVNVLESLDVVQKDRASSYTWFGLTQLPRCVLQLEAASGGAGAVRLLPDCPIDEESAIEAGKGGRRGQLGRDDDDNDGGRKEKSIKELSVKFVGLFLQVSSRPAVPPAHPTSGHRVARAPPHTPLRPIARRQPSPAPKPHTRSAPSPRAVAGSGGLAPALFSSSASLSARPFTPSAPCCCAAEHQEARPGWRPVPRPGRAIAPRPPSRRRTARARSCRHEDQGKPLHHP